MKSISSGKTKGSHPQRNRKRKKKVLMKDLTKSGARNPDGNHLLTVLLVIFQP